MPYTVPGTRLDGTTFAVSVLDGVGAPRISHVTVRRDLAFSVHPKADLLFHIVAGSRFPAGHAVVIVDAWAEIEGPDRVRRTNGESERGLDLDAVTYVEVRKVYDYDVITRVEAQIGTAQ